MFVSHPITFTSIGLWSMDIETKEYMKTKASEMESLAPTAGYNLLEHKETKMCQK